MKNSLWSKVTISERNPLTGSVKTDVAIIGAGLAGVLTAYQLQKKALIALWLRRIE